MVHFILALGSRYSPLPAGKVNDKKDMERIERAVAHIYAHLNRPLSLSEVARQACLSSSYFNRLFRQKTGEPPMAFIGRLKVERAKTLMVNADLTMRQVSEQFGFQSQAHFTRKFKQVTGQSPSAFLKQYNP